MQNIYDAPIIIILSYVSKRAALNQQILRDYHKQLKELKKGKKGKPKAFTWLQANYINKALGK